jgi:hypothetical protein
MTANAKIAYASKDGKLVHVSSVERGLKCGCTCPSCGAQVIARKGSKKVHHFAHTMDANCSGAAETALHILTKEIISELPALTLPEYKFEKQKLIRRRVSVEHEEVLVKGGNAIIEAVHLEPHYGDVKPDIELCSGGKRLFVEVAVTHKVGKKKLRVIRQHDVPTIEIRLSESHALRNREELKKIIQSDVSIKHWLYHPREKKASETFFKKYRKTQRNYCEALYKQGLAPYKSERNAFDLEYVSTYIERFVARFGRYPSKREVLGNWPWVSKETRKTIADELFRVKRCGSTN